MNGGALWLLARRKLAASLRVHGRRLRTPGGALFAICALGLFATWYLAVSLGVGLGTLEPPRRSPEELGRLVRVGALFLALFAVGSSVTHRGLFLPADELERLLAAPLSRAAIVRYRLGVAASRSLLAGLLVGVLVMGRMPNPTLALVGCVIGMLVLPVIGQTTALLAGGLEQRSMRFLSGWPIGLARLICFVLALGVFLVLVFGDAVESSVLRSIAEAVGRHGGEGAAAVVDNPVVLAASLPFEPWARMIVAPDLATFLPWAGASLVASAAIFELTARLPFDFRGLSLETSASVAERIRRHRRSGGGVSSGRATLKDWRAPWVFGRGPEGAIAWRKATSILRKARGTVIVSVFVLSLVTLFVGAAFDGTERSEVLTGAGLIVVLGTFYLAAGLRFDFREDLPLLDAIKAWPCSPRRVFVATVLPEVLVVALLEVGCIGLRAVATGGLDPWLAFVAVLVPFHVFAWVALDNAVFLFAPVRHVPGRAGALQNIGRSTLMTALRFALLAVLGGAVFAFAAAAYFGAGALGSSEGAASGVAAAGALVAFALVDVLLAVAGGRMLARFDVSRELV